MTSPPYFAGKQYEEALGQGHIPDTYLNYLKMLEDVFAACVEALEPGGRIAVNVANLGRKPYVSLSSDVIQIFQRLGLLLRGEILWRKAKGAGGNCAWGSYRSAVNPVLRDVTERIIVASKGRFDRAVPLKKRAQEELPHKNTMTGDEFMEATLDLWELPPESAKRIGHPAPFPVTLPRRLIELFTFEGDLVLDPFLGAGSTLVAAQQSHRRAIGLDTDADYIRLSEKRLAEDSKEQELLPPEKLEEQSVHREAQASGRLLKGYAEDLLIASGFRIQKAKPKVRGAGIEFDFLVEDSKGASWYVEVSGAFSSTQPRAGLMSPEVVLKTLGKAHIFKEIRTAQDPRLLLLTTHLPHKGPARQQLRAVGFRGYFDALSMCSLKDRERLAHYGTQGAGKSPKPGWW